MENPDFQISMLKKYPDRLIWNMNRNCNLSCEYCFFAGNGHRFSVNEPAFSPAEIQKAFDNTGKRWLILLTGGEPFLYPEIYKVLELLAEKHCLQITTNLMACDPARLKTALAPEAVMMLSASLHISTKKDEESLQVFIRRYHALKDAGFPVLVNYVTYPPLFIRMEEDIRLLKQQGVGNITVLTYRGRYGGKKFPGSYSRDQLALISRHALDPSENLIARGKNKYYGHYCEAGIHYFSMDTEGNVFRCGTINQAYGNLFSGTFEPGAAALPCTAKRCDDCYLGMISLSGKKVSPLKMLFSRTPKK